MIVHKPRVIVLILTYNGKFLLEDSVSTYLENDYENFEVVVIDNASSDGTIDYLQATYPTVKVIQNKTNLGYSAGFNIGMKYAFDEQNAEFVLISNNDVKVNKNAISELVKVALTDSQIGFVTGKVYYFDQPNTLQTVGRKTHPILWSGGSLGRGEIDTGQYDDVSERFLIDDIFWLVGKPMYDEIGGYDETFFMQAEDYEWQARAKLKGYKIFFTPYAQLWHKVSITIGKQSPMKAYYDARNPLIVILMHMSPPFFKKYFWFFLKKVLLNSLKNIYKKRFRIAMSQYRGLLSALAWGFKSKRFTWRHFV